MSKRLSQASFSFHCHGKRKNTVRIVFLVVYFILAFAEIQANNNTASTSNANVSIEIGIDSLERRYYRPQFRFDFPLSFATIFSQISYHQITNGKLQGRIDYWVMVGLEKEFNSKLKFEFRLNHLCRHMTSQDNPSVFNLNEVIGKLWVLTKKFKLGFGVGGYTGGSVDYKSLFQLNGEYPHILGSEVSFLCEFKIVDFKEILHEAEISFSLSKSTDLFLKNTHHYELKNNTYIGLRMKSKGNIEKYIDSLRISTGIHPFYKKHKLSVEGEFRLAFFDIPKSRVVVSVNFDAPILRGETFLGKFYPEKMVYSIFLQYDRKIKESLFLAWTSKYCVSMPLDKDLEFSASLATGIALKNQLDFEMLEKKIRYDIFAGYNFKHKFEIDVKLGTSFLKSDLFNFGSTFRFSRSNEKRFADFRLFVDYGKKVTFRPFIGVQRIEYFNLQYQQSSKNRLSFGFELFRWFN